MSRRPLPVLVGAPPALDSTAAAALALAMALASAQRTRRPRRTAAARRLRRMTLGDFARDVYLPAKNLAADGPTAELVRAALVRLRQCLGREPRVAQATAAAVDRFRDYLAGLVVAGMIRPATANKHLRHLRAVVNHAAKRRAVRRLPPLEFLAESPPDVEAWTVADLARLEAQARTLTGDVAGVPAALWWTAWVLCLSRCGCRIGAMMAAARGDYARGVLLLRAENQKQKRDQRLALSPKAAAAVERLLECHTMGPIWPWPHDPPRTGRRRKFKTLSDHFRRKLLAPCGLKLPRGVKTRQFRRTAATLIDEAGGNAQMQLGHGSERTTQRYKDRRRTPVCREGLLIPDSPQIQLELFR